jgi:hypothetical protein
MDEDSNRTEIVMYPSPVISRFIWNKELGSKFFSLIEEAKKDRQMSYRILAKAVNERGVKCHHTSLEAIAKGETGEVKGEIITAALEVLGSSAVNFFKGVTASIPKNLDE